MQISIMPPYPKDVHVVHEGDSHAHSQITLYRSCAEEVVEEHDEALASAGQDTHEKHASMLNYELGMFVMLGISLPIVYWRKIRVRHL